MSSLKLFLFGSPHVRLDGQDIPIERRKMLALLAYLALSPTRPQRDTLAALLWPEFPPERSRSNLRREIFALNSIAESAWLASDRNTVGLTPDLDLWVDVQQFQKILVSIQPTDMVGQQARLEEAASLFCGDFLEGFNLPDCPDFEEWQFFQRESLRNLYIRTLQQLVSASFSDRQPEKTIQYTLKWVMADPLNESAYQQLIHLFLKAGQISQAVTYYERCVKMLKEDLQSSPSLETRALHRQIVQYQAVPLLGSTQPILDRLPFSLPVSLPKYTTPFIGREYEIQQVEELLQTHRLVTLSGSGGVGKTRLAIQVAHNIFSQYADGVWYTDLSLVIDQVKLVSSVASSIGIQNIHDEANLLEFLKEKHALIVFNNCEQIIDDCAYFIQTIIQECEHIQFLVTSREVLRLPGESIFRVPSLSVPDLVRKPYREPIQLIEGLRANESVRLLINRGQEVLPAFDVTVSNMTHAASICRRLDGIPLAIELAAARLNMLSIEELDRGLDKAFHILSGGSRTALPRHRTLRVTIDWSYEMLSSQERLLFSRLAVFTGSYTLEAVETICSEDGLDEDLILDALASLVNKSMAIAEPSAQHETRYHLLEVIRQYALEKLSAADEETRMHTRHAQYYTIFCETAEPHLISADRLEWVDRLQADFDNIRAAVHWSFDHHSTCLPLVEHGLRITVALGRYLQIQNLHSEEKEWLEKGLKIIETEKIEPLLLAQVYIPSCCAFSNKMNYVEKCIQLSRSIGVQALPVLASALSRLAYIHVNKNDLVQARSLVFEAIETARRLRHTDRWYLGQTLWNCSDVLVRDPENHDLAYRIAVESVHIMREVGDRWNIPGLHTMGNIEAYRGNLDQAIRIFEEELGLYFEANDKGGILWGLDNLSWMHILRGDLCQALHFSQSHLRYAYPNYSDLGWSLYTMVAILVLESRRHDLAKKETLLYQVAVVNGIIGRMGMIYWNYPLPGIKSWIKQTNDIIHTECSLEQFPTAYTEGAAMTLDQVMAYAGALSLDYT